MSVRGRLLLAFFVITAGAVSFVYLYVVPQLNSSLTAERLSGLQEVGKEQSRRVGAAISAGASQVRLQRVIDGAARKSDTRVTVLGIRPGVAGPQPEFVIGDSELERTAILPTYPAATGAIATGGESTAIEQVSGERLGQLAIAGSTGPEPRWVTVLSDSLEDVDDTVALIRRQILIAGGIAILAALAAGWFAARAHSRRLRRLEAAAEKVAEGDFRSPIPIDSGDEVGQLASTFNEMQKRLARLDSARREFIANASHELRTPITSLGGFVELLEHENPDPESQAEFVRTMRGQVDRLTKLTADLLDLSKLDSDALEISPQRVELGPVAARVAEEFGPAAERHESSIELPRNGEVAATADPERVAQILRILIDNALTHTPEGTAISIETQSSNGTTTLSVRDNGPGIEPQARERVFERFYTGDEVGGSGLGLAIARELARRMDGGLGVASHRGRTEFTLRLPAATYRGART
jgi:two-component system, OmpR family, sensor kinase